MHAKAATVYGYARVSTNGQAEDGYGLDIQHERIKAYCASQGWILREIVEDAGISGSTIEDRPGLKGLLKKAETGEVDTLVVLKLDRLTRSLLDLVNLTDRVLIPNEVALVSVTESLDTQTPNGKLMLQILASFAEFERSLIAERMSGGRRAKALKGGRACGSIYGYRTSGGTVEVVPEEAEVVRRIFSLYLKVRSARKVKAALDADGIVNRRGKPFGVAAILYILQNPFYAGKVRYGEIEGKGAHEPMVSAGSFGKVQACLHGRGR